MEGFANKGFAAEATVAGVAKKDHYLSIAFGGF